MGEFLKKIDWFYYTILTTSLVVAYFLSAAVTQEIPELPMWYSQSASVGMALVFFAVLVTIRLLVTAAYQIIRNAMAAGGGHHP